MNRGEVSSMYERLELPEAYEFFLTSFGRGDMAAARQIVDAMPNESYGVRSSHLANLHNGFRTVVEVVERELRPASAQLGLLEALYASTSLHAALTGAIASRMYLCGVASGAEGTLPSEEQESEAARLEEAVRLKLGASGEVWSQVDTTVRRSAANVIHAFDEICRSVGVSADVVARSHGLSDLPLDEFRRVKATPEDLKTWFDLLLKLWFDEVGSVVDDAPPGR